MQSKAVTVQQYLAELPRDRREAIQAVRQVILDNLDTKGPDGKGGFEEGMSYGMIGYFVPHRVFPAGYHCDPKQPLPFAALASQKNHMSVYLMSLYAEGDDLKWLKAQYAKAGKKLDMGKCCIRFRKLEDLPLSVLGEVIRRVTVKGYIDYYQRALSSNHKAAAARSKAKTAKQKVAKPGAKRANKTAKKVTKRAVKSR